MIHGEFESMKVINSIAGEFAPEVYGWGSYCRDSDTYFLLSQFVDIGGESPDPIEFGAKLAEMHKKSRFSTGKFGFHVTTCVATLPQATTIWTDLWEDLFKRLLKNLMDMDLEKNGMWPDFERLCRLTLHYIIPRLLRPLQSGSQ